MGFRSLGLKGLATVCVVAPAIATGYFAADPSNILFATQAEAHIKDLAVSLHPRQQGQGRASLPLPADASHLFARPGKGPRADRYRDVAQTSQAAKEPPVRMVALTPYGEEVTGALPRQDMAAGGVNRTRKSDRIFPPLVKQATLQPEIIDTRPSAALFLASLSNAGSYSFPGSNEQEAGPKKPAGKVKLPRGLVFKGETEAEYQARQRRCLATAIYFEARGESERGQLAVAQVVMNRVRSSLYPDTICGVVFQGQLRRSGCQFSFTCDGRADVPREKEQWIKANQLAEKVTSGKVWLEEIGHATHYHATYVRPKWRRQMDHIKRVGRHIFYRVREDQIEDVLNPGGSPAQGLALATNG
ncbi:MAG: cell wall hydrolase [Alphaproteobacteria bacterium]|nr:MAG: cell wall hydrolase [Alphaproteobacteria bacterium]